MGIVEVHTPFAPEARSGRDVAAIRHLRESRGSLLENGKLNAKMALGTIPLAEHWSRFTVIVAGGHGKHTAWMPTFGRAGKTETVWTRIEHPDGSPVASILGIAER